MASALRENEVAALDYVYDFGDNWRHRIKEKKLEPMPKEMLPLCVAGANARPPEDCGGVYGYNDFVSARRRGMIETGQIDGGLSSKAIETSGKAKI